MIFKNMNKDKNLNLKIKAKNLWEKARKKTILIKIAESIFSK